VSSYLTPLPGPLDVDDLSQIGNNEPREITVANRGSAEGTNTAVIWRLPPARERLLTVRLPRGQRFADSQDDEPPTLRRELPGEGGRR
jgi:hypothetical protein